MRNDGQVAELLLTDVRGTIYCDACGSVVERFERGADTEPVDVGLLYSVPMTVSRWASVQPCGHWSPGSMAVTRSSEAPTKRG